MSDRDKDPLGFGPADADGEEAGREPEERDGTGTPRERPPRDPEKYAHRRDPDLAAYGIHPSAKPQPARLPAGQSRYTWFVGVVAVLVIAYVSVNSIRTDSNGSRGAAVGVEAPPFAAPLATGNLSGDVNVARRGGQGDAGAVTACSIRRPDVLTSCDLWDDKPLVLVFFATRSRACADEVTVLQRIARGRDDVAFAAVAIRGSRSDVRKQIAANGWTFPVGYDHDGVLANLYSVAVCPQIAYISQGGKVAGASFGKQTQKALVRRIDLLAAGRPLPDEP